MRPNVNIPLSRERALIYTNEAQPLFTITSPGPREVRISVRTAGYALSPGEAENALREGVQGLTRLIAQASGPRIVFSDESKQGQRGKQPDETATYDTQPINVTAVILNCNRSFLA